MNITTTIFNPLQMIGLDQPGRYQEVNFVDLLDKGKLITKQIKTEILSEMQDLAIDWHYDGDDIEIGFNAKFLIEMLSNIESDKVILKLSEPNRAGLLIPEDINDNEDITMLVMPVMLNDNA